MKRYFPILILAALMCVSCAAYVGPHGAGVSIGPPLPYTMESANPYYAYSGRPDYYNNDRGYYAQSGSGPWRDLPRDQYPREVRYKVYRNERDWTQDRYYRY
jgi:hypothetical protein